MFAKSIVMSDAFLDMPMSARCLYFTLGMMADDDGFVNSPRSIMRQIGSSDDDMRLLIARKFVLIFDSGVIVIKHWRINNYLRSDRYRETNYADEKSLLTLDNQGIYHVSDSGIPAVDQRYTSGVPRVGKDSIGKDSLVESSGTPSLEEIETFVKERNSPVDPKRFFAYYNFSGWKDGHGNPIRNWKQKLISWEGTERNSRPDDQKPKNIPEWDDEKAIRQIERLRRKMEGEKVEDLC